MYIDSPLNFYMEKADADQLCESLFSTISRELPENLQTYEVIGMIFSECQERIKRKKLRL